MPKKLAEGKTKIIKQDKDPRYVLVESKDDLTAGNGAKHDVVKGKSIISTATTCNVFKILKECDIPVSFVEQVDEKTFRAQRCDMILYEVVVRRAAHGSSLKRNPIFEKDQRFNKLLVEFYLKTSGKKWGNNKLPVDDPYIKVGKNISELYRPDKPLYAQEPFLTLKDFPLKGKENLVDEMTEIAKKTFLILEKCWSISGYKMVDFKIEFGINQEKKLVIADVIDNDSWRVLGKDGGYLDKQFYRDGGDVNEVTRRYKRVMELAGQFSIPEQQIVLWRGSDKDDLAPFYESMKDFGITDAIEVKIVTCSMHKMAVQGLEELDNIVYNKPNSVVLAYIGRSNGAGPTLSAHTHVPVVTVPAGYKNYPADIHSSLRTPSSTPVATILEPGNAVMFALEVFAYNNPRIYAELRSRLEERRVNMLLLE